ncbi:MAG: hypothetical protein ABIC40_08985 [bacterium]
MPDDSRLDYRKILYLAIAWCFHIRTIASGLRQRKSRLIALMKSAVEGT